MKKNTVYPSLNRKTAYFSPRYSVQFSHSVISDSLRPHGLQHTRLFCPSPTSGAYSNPCPSSGNAIQPSHPLASLSPPAFNLSQHQDLFNASVLHIRWPKYGVSASASVLPMDIQDLFLLGWIGWTSFQSKGLSRVFSNTTVQKHQFLGTQLSSPTRWT